MATGPHAVWSADDALRKLKDGNDRFVGGRPQLQVVHPQLRAELAEGQQPCATVLGCSDSRVPPEIVFDAAFGELFVVRVAGNILDPAIMGTLQYAGQRLHTPLFVVLGHEGCGAVHAALEEHFQGIRPPSRIAKLLEHIGPALDDIDPSLSPSALLSAAVESNVRWSVRQLQESPEGRARAAQGEIRLLGAVYDIGSGRVRFLD
jgi:carbonic anhydrase